MIAAAIVSGVLCACLAFERGLQWLERRDIRRFEQRTELLRLKGAASKAEDVTKLEQRVRALEMKGLTR